MKLGLYTQTNLGVAPPLLLVALPQLHNVFILLLLVQLALRTLPFYVHSNVLLLPLHKHTESFGGGRAVFRPVLLEPERSGRQMRLSVFARTFVGIDQDCLV